MDAVTAVLLATGIPVPDSGPSGVFIGIVLLSAGVVARLIKNRMR